MPWQFADQWRARACLAFDRRHEKRHAIEAVILREMHPKTMWVAMRVDPERIPLRVDETHHHFDGR